MDYTVGQLAKLCGISVRSLHHYEALGLLVPSHRSASGYRLYTGGDVQRLHGILAYRQLGVPLKDIAKFLGPYAPPLKEVLARQREAAQKEAARLHKLVSLLDRLISSPASRDEESITPQYTDQLIELMNTMQSIEKHFSSDEQQTLKSVRDQLTPAGVETARKELGELLAGFKAACDNDADVKRADVADLARRWKALGAPALQHTSLRTKTRSLLQSSAEVQKATGMTPQLMAYIDRAVAATGTQGT